VVCLQTFSDTTEFHLCGETSGPSFSGKLVAMLDQKSVGALLALPLAHPDQDPPAVHAACF
jgi:hypothetical protein